MEKSRSPIAAAGFGGAALIAILSGPLAGLRFGTPPAPPASPSASDSAAVSSTAANTLNFNSSGPWYAVCREYLTNEPDAETKAASHPPDAVAGVFAHVDPLDASGGQSVYVVKDKSGQAQNLAVTRHFSADLKACTTADMKVQARVVVATVADPIASHMQLHTDRAIDAISHAAATEGYSLSSYWMPWRIAAAGSAQAAENEAAQSSLQEPGVLIFRKSARNGTTPGKQAEAKQLLFVFLVGETPTSGINRLQMARALRDAHDIASQENAFEPHRLLISGPMFSGTYSSLADLLNASAWSKETTAVTVISPITSVQDEIDTFRTRTGARLVSLGLNSARVEEAAKLELTRRFNLREDQIAWLSEDESLYGNNPLRTAANTKADETEVPSRTKLEGVLHLQFPRDLSALRNSTDPGGLLMNSTELGGSAPVVNGIALSLAEKISGNTDSPPSFAGAQEAVRTEAILHEVVERMHERHIQAVVVAASNSLDQLYLLDFLRRDLPNVRLVAVDADQFMTQRPAHVSLLGTLVLTGLPLLPGEETNETGGGTTMPVVLPSSSATGEYLALRLLLQPETLRAAAMARLSPQLDTAKATEQAAGTPRQKGLPIEDLASFVVGHHGLEALEGSNLFTTYPVGEPQVYIRASVNPFPTAWLFVLAAVAVLTMWHLAALFFAGDLHLARRVRKRLPRAWLSTMRSSPRWAYPPAPPVGRPAWLQFASHRLYYIYVACNQVALLQFAACSVTAVLLLNFWLLPGLASTSFRTAPAPPWLLLGLFLLNLPLLAAALLQALQHGRRFGKGASGFPSMVERITLLLTRLFPVVSTLVWIAVLTGTTGDGHWFHLRDSAATALRCAQVGHGLSPFVPLGVTVIAFLLWAVLNLRRVAAASSRRIWIEPHLAPAAGLFACNGSITQLHGKLHTQLESCLQHQDLKELVLFAVWCLGLCFVQSWDATRGIDGIFFHLWILAYGMGLLLLICAIEILAAFRRWWALKALLDFLDRTPIALELCAAKLNTELDSMRIWQVGGINNSALIQSHTFDGFPPLQAYAGKRLLTVWLRRTSSGCWVHARTAERLSKMLNAPLLTHAGAFDNTAVGTPAWPASAHYLALRFIALILYALMQIRNSLTFVVWGFAAAILSIASYPFQGEHSIGGFILVTCLLLIGAIAFLLVQIERHPLLSRLEGSEAGKSSFLQVAGQLISIGGLPLIAVLGSQFPAFGDFLLSWVRPALEASH